jgi:flagellar M-ring protein FliF
MKEEMRLARSVEQLLESVLGPGKVRAEVRADMAFDKTVTNQEIYDPDSQVARSTVTREQSAQTNENEPDAVSVSQNLPNAQVNNTGAQATSSDTSTEETTNFEISRKTVNSVNEAPSIQRLSVAVLVDGTYQTDAEGTKVYQARPEAEMDKLNALVRSAIGYDANRGDQIEMVNMQFTGLDEIDLPEPWSFMGFSKEEVMRMAEGLGVAIVAVLVILLVVRPLVARAFDGAAAGADQKLLGADGSLAPQLTGPGGVPAPIPEEEDLSDELIDIDKVEGRVKASSLRKIGEIVDKHPEEALSIIRNWLYQET